MKGDFADADDARQFIVKRAMAVALLKAADMLYAEKEFALCDELRNIAGQAP